MKWLFRRKREQDRCDRESMARLEQAERDLTHLQSRADRALGTLDSRDKRNHWRESIEQMITGAL